MQLTSKEQELLLTYQNWLKENKLSDRCNAYFVEANSTLIFLNWNLEYESFWQKLDKDKWEYKHRNSETPFNKYFSLNKIIEIEKDYIIQKDFKWKNTSNYT